MYRLTAAMALLATMALGACHGRSHEEEITAENWTCDKLVQPVIDMSKGKDVEILEISKPEQEENVVGMSIKCGSNAELSHGNGYLEYGAHVSQGGSIILEYNVK